ncbi:RHS repeat-associated core domain-containing protein [Apibacter mensalis]|uniref:RHS repeat-associated core domain-containing protein n=1 Tax=Apibacter mensalis TaxID=1586267 RepID=UPI0026F336DF|nr:RHS repeat-associated core domain-containing protein [Apibacter mensalis]
MQYYYHPDHLGSSRYITNLDGEIVQHVEYVPFGEVFIEERNNSWNTPYLFNGKELDEETGLYYYGARYYNPRESVWLSVDPLAEKYPNVSPYAYTFQNPINYTDPTGMIPEDGAGDPPKRSWFGRNIIKPIEDFFKMRRTLRGESSSGVGVTGASVEVGEIEQTHDPETIAIWNAEDNYIGGEPFSGLAEVTTQGIQWLGEQITGSDVSEETANNIQLGTDIIVIASSKGKNIGRLGKQEKLRELANDLKLGKADRGWIKSEIRQVRNKNRKSIRNPPGKDLAHERGREAAKGYSYKHSKLQDRDLHRRQHKYDNVGRKNKERPIE